MPAGKPRKVARNTLGKIITSENTSAIYKCTKCGKLVGDGKTIFYSSKYSPLFTGNESYTHICCECINKIIQEEATKYDLKTAYIIACHYLDINFNENIYETMKVQPNFSFGVYIRTINMQKSNARNFTSFLVDILKDGNGLKAKEELAEYQEQKWLSSDLKNKNTCIHLIGYNCFEDEKYTQEQLKFLYNTLSDYLTDDVVDDPYKIQCMISLTKSHLQVEVVDRLITAELRGGTPNEQRLKNLSDIKIKLCDSINKTADDNGISAKSSGKNKKSSNSLGDIMKEMESSGFEEIKVNIIDAKLSESYKEIATENARAIFNELNLQTDEYASMVAEQSSVIREYQAKIEELEEEKRLLLIRLEEERQ